ncbi:hypothetical protein HG530_006795 [Fusarium avenaceum]|nr:hypothetical protein HG530_006795 [Fusarium avenaceum]
MIRPATPVSPPKKLSKKAWPDAKEICSSIGVPVKARSVSEGQDELQNEEGDVDVFDKDVDDGRGRIAKRPSVVCGENLGVSDKLHDDRGGEVERAEREPTEQDVEQIVDELDVEEKEADDVVARTIHSAKMHQGIQRHGERSVEPSTSLANKLSSAFRDISLAL